MRSRPISKKSKKKNFAASFILKDVLPFAFLVVVVVSVGIAAWAHAKQSNSTGYDIIIVAGQSNAVGHGIGPQPDAGPTGFDNRIFQVGRFGLNKMQIIPAVDPLDFWKNKRSAYLGLALPFARYYAASSLLGSGRNVLIVPAAHGETSVLMWLGTIPSVEGTDTLWTDMQARVQLALSQPGDNRIVAIVWQQGEQDVLYAITPTDPNHTLMPDAPTYHTALSQLVGRFQTAYGTNIPFLMGEMSPEWLASTTDFATKKAFNSVIQTVTIEKPHASFINSNGLTSDFDIDGTSSAIHFSAEGEGLLGGRYWTSLAKMKGITPSK